MNRPEKRGPGQYVGFSLQQLRLCDYLLWVPYCPTASLEVADDVSGPQADESTVLDQSKSL